MILSAEVTLLESRAEQSWRLEWGATTENYQSHHRDPQKSGWIDEATDT